MYLNRYYFPTLRTKNIDCSPASVNVPVQLRKEQVDMPDISDAAPISSRLSPARSLPTARVRLVDEDGGDQLKTARQETTRP